ncbi:MAG: hypothetical protein DMD34_00665 [Gemmatimonadetes bacterium]|nr:MAG: hypothetical protein DMD34_00665 [Gemmatimonadota bacterium]
MSRPTIIGIVGPSALLLGLTPLSAQAPGGNRASGTTAAATPAAATPAATSIIVQRVPEPPRLDDFLGERPAPGAAVTSDFRQREPGDGVPVSAPTTAYLSYDDANLYVVFVCQDDPAKIRAGLTRREEITVDDGVALYLDTFHDRKRAYLFQANPNGVQLDGIVTEGQDDDYSFDAVWDSDGRLTPNGYVVRIAIPFRSLRFPSTPTQTWGIALVRYIRRTNEEASWPLVTKRLAGFVPQFGTLEGLREISPGRNLQAIPYGAYTGARFLDTEQPAFRQASDRRVGIDVKAVVKDALTLDGTVNPDFSQVESDEPQVTINERFEVFYPEKRPFFIENAGYFQTPVNLFFSRRVSDPGAGLRLTSKAGRWAVGAIGINDRAPEEFVGSGLAREPRAGVGVVRVERGIGRESAIGLFVSDRQLGGAANRVASADARLALSKTWIFTSQLISTHSRDSGDVAASGAGLFAELLRDGRNLDYSATYTDVGSTFDAPLGYVPRIGVREVEQQLEIVKRPDGPVVKIGPTFTTAFTWDRGGALLDRSLKASWEVKLVGETKFQLAYESAFELFKDIPFDIYATKLAFESQWLKWLAWAATWKQGTDVNHKPPSGADPFRANAGEAELLLTFRPSARLRWDHTYLYSRLTALTGARVFTEGIVREKVNYQFSRALSLRVIVDYSTVDRDSTLSRVDPERHWAVDLLLTCLVNPGTAAYVGYRDGYENLAMQGNPPTLYRTGAPTVSVGRQVFVKLSYLFRF